MALFKESITIQRDEAHKKLLEEFEKKESENKKFPDSAEGYHVSVNYKSDHVLVADEFDANRALNGTAALLWTNQIQCLGSGCKVAKKK